MKLNLLYLLMLPVFIFGACTQEEATEQMTDADLISAIQRAEKVEIDPSALPDNATVIVSRDFEEDYTDRALLATELGYEVRLRGSRGTRMGQPTDLYFNLNGRKLDAERGMRGRRGGPNGEGRSGHGPKECFELVFPVTFVMPDGTSVTGDDEATVRDAIKAWYNANPDAKGRPELQFPVSVILDDGTELNEVTKEQLQEIRLDCKPGSPGHHGPRRRCFEFVFPVSFTMPDGSVITGESGPQLREALKAWHEANPDVKERPEPQFPLDVILKDSTQKTLTTLEEFQELVELCGSKGGPGQGGHHGPGMKAACFELVYPVSFTMPDNSTITGENREEVRDAIKAWREANPGVKGRPMLVFPVEIVYKDGTTKEIADQAEMRAARKDCK